MLYLDKQTIERSYQLDRGIPLVSDALVQISADAARRSEEIHLPRQESDHVRLSAAVCADLGIAAVLVSPVFFNAARAPREMILYDLASGCRLAIADFAALAGVRNATLAAIATDALAPIGAKVLAVLGADGDVTSLVRAICRVREIDTVVVWNADCELASAQSSEISGSLRVRARACATCYEASAEADVLCVFSLPAGVMIGTADVRAGAHINLLPVSEASGRTVTSGLIAAARVYIEDARIAENTGGNLSAAVRERAVSRDHVMGQIGQVLSGRLMRPRGKKRVTIFEAWGHSREDLVVAKYILEEVVREKNDMGK